MDIEMLNKIRGVQNHLRSLPAHVLSSLERVNIDLQSEGICVTFDPPLALETIAADS